jgi:hypothetical protein
MPDPSFVRYVGDPDFHDGSIISVEEEGDAVHIRLRGASGSIYNIKFSGVREVRTKHPEGMLIYALCELRCDPPLRRYAFAKWDEDEIGLLEVDAESISVRPV